jgi:hypothetical protein
VDKFEIDALMLLFSISLANDAENADSTLASRKEIAQCMKLIIASRRP